MRRPDDGGSLAIEYVIVAPLFLIVFGLIFAFFRVGQLDSLLDSGARDGARAVSVSPDLSHGYVQAVARNSVTFELNGGLGGCDSNNVQVDVAPVRPDDTGKYQPVAGQTDLKPGDVAQVTVTCKYSLSDLGLPVPGLSGLQARSVFYAIVDPNRSTQ